MAYFQVDDLDAPPRCGPLCEDNPYLDRVTGTCVDNGTRCECPPGFDGIDTWNDYRDCHVRIVVREFMDLLICCISIVSFLYCLYLLFRMAKVWGLLSILPDFVNDKIALIYKLFESGVSVVSTGTPGDHPKTTTPLVGNGAPSTMQKEKSFTHKMKRTRRTHQVTFLMVVFFFFGSFGSFLYTLLNSLPTPIYRFQNSQNSVIQTLSFCVAASCMIISLWGVVVIWYSNLPSLRLYATLFSVNSILVRDSTVIPKLIMIHLVLIIICSPIDLIFIPLGLPQYRTITDSLFLLFSALVIISFTIFISGVAFLLRAAYQKSLFALLTLENSPIAKNNVHEQRRRSGFQMPEKSVIIGAIRRINFLVILVWAGATYTTFIFFAMTFVSFFRTNAHIFFSTIALIANLSSILFCGLLVHLPLFQEMENLKKQGATSDLGFRVGHTPGRPPAPDIAPIQEVPDITSQMVGKE